ncbi:hypothetical protein ESCO_000422 [Escovopsis weberi]|uniref:Uncharacterized protein n=1 Tax=Escovopsis weberi TaxID=150374 RepID=A0A0M8MVE6_ESCWE|nr:hypothetical protein ESCO_000422 [Escovopsis weberi]
MTVLHAGCTQKPEPGVTLGILGNLFSNNAVKIVPPSPTATINPDWFDQGPLTLGGKVGIAIGCIIFVLMLAGMAVIWRGKKRRRQFLRKIETQYANTNTNTKHNEGGGEGGGGWPSPQRDMGETPLSQRPLRGWDDSPMTLSTEKTFPRYFSPYSSQYNSPVSAQEGHQMAWPEPALGTPREIGIALADRHQWLQSPVEQDREKGKTRDDSCSHEYEMQHVDGVGGGFPSINQATS